MPEPIHLGAEFLFSSQGRVKTVEQGTTECTVARVFHVAVCEEGALDSNPSFGIPDPTFKTVPLDLSVLEAAILRSEPEASLELIEQAYSAVVSQREIQMRVS